MNNQAITAVDPATTARGLLQDLNLMQPGRWHYRVPGILVTDRGTAIDFHDWAVRWWDITSPGQPPAYRTVLFDQSVSLAAIAAIATSLEVIDQHRPQS